MLGAFPAVPVHYQIPGYYRYFEEVSPTQEGPRSEWKRFEHYKLATSSGTDSSMRVPLASSTVYSSDGTTAKAWVNEPYVAYETSQYGAGGQLNLGLTPLYVKRSDLGFVPEPDDLQALKDASLAFMLPLIRPELSLINSIIELKDFASLPRTIKTLSSLPELIPSVRQRFALAYRSFTKSAREWARAGADSYLQAKFNILPLLSDISGIKTALTRTERRLNDFITRAGRVQRRHYTRVLNEYPLSSYSENNVPLPVSPLYNGGLSFATTSVSRRYVYSQPTTFHAEIQYNYNYTEYQIEHARLLSLLDAVGANFNPAVIWNAIPWSFVVDWVFGVSRWLNNNRVGLMDPQINIHRYLWSVKRSRKVLVQRQFTALDNAILGSSVKSQWIPLPIVNESAYRREVGLPEASSITSSGLNANEFSLGAALVIARRSHQTRRTSWPSNFTGS